MASKTVPSAQKESVSSGPLSFKTKFFFGLGSFAEAVGLFSVASYAMLYYNQVLGLRADLAGLALSAGLLLDGPADLFMGYVSDRTKSRFGRRHLYMYLAPAPIAIALYAIFNPPEGLGQIALFGWFIVSVVLLRQFMNVFHTPHSALGAELSKNYTERSTVMSYASFATSLGATAQAFVALSFFFTATEEYPRGILNPEPWQNFAFTMAAVVFVTLYASSWYTRDRIPYLPQPPANQKSSIRLSAFLSDVRLAFSNRNYSVLIIGYFFLTMTTGIRTGLSLYTNTYYWGLPSESMRWIALSALFGAIIAFVVTPKLHRYFEKRTAIIVASIVQAIIPAIPILLSLAGIIPKDTPYLIPLLVLFQSIGWLGYGVLTISVLSSMADVADENELKYGLRQEGVMYAMRNMFGKIDQAIGAALTGFILTWIAFPMKAKVEDVPADTLNNIALSDGVLATIPGLIAIIPYFFFRINRQSHAATQKAIRQKRAQKQQPKTSPDSQE